MLLVLISESFTQFEVLSRTNFPCNFSKQHISHFTSFRLSLIFLKEIRYRPLLLFHSKPLDACRGYAIDAFRSFGVENGKQKLNRLRSCLHICLCGSTEMLNLLQIAGTKISGNSVLAVHCAPYNIGRRASRYRMKRSIHCIR